MFYLHCCIRDGFGLSENVFNLKMYPEDLSECDMKSSLHVMWYNTGETQWIVM